MIEMVQDMAFEDPDKLTYILCDCNDNDGDNEEKTQIMPKVDEYDTGDIILFSSRTIIPSIISKWFSNKYSHVAMILKDPTFIDPLLKGLYLINISEISDLLPESISPKSISPESVSPESIPLESMKLSMNNTNKYDFFREKILVFSDVYKKFDGAMFWRKFSKKSNTILSEHDNSQKVQDTYGLYEIYCRNINKLKMRGDLESSHMKDNFVLNDEVLIKDYNSYAHYMYYTF